MHTAHGRVEPARLSYADAVRSLAAAQKSGSGAPPYSRWINRPLGRRLAALAYRVGLSPNQVTLLSGGCSLAAILGIALIRPQAWLGLVVGVLLVLGYALDSADGQLARLIGGGSLAGEWLDHMVDTVKVCLLHSAVLISLYRFGSADRPWLLVPLGYLLVSVVFFVSFLLIGKLRLEAAAGSERRSSGRGLLQTVVALPTDYGVLCLVFFAFGWPTLFLVLYTALFAAHTLVLSGAMARWWRELTGLTRAPR